MVKLPLIFSVVIVLFSACRHEKKAACIEPRMDAYNGVKSYWDYDSSLVYARCVNKPLFVFFTGWTCVSTRKMEESILPSYWIRKKLNNDFIMVTLYFDDRTPIKDTFNSEYLKRVAKTEGDRNFHFSISKFKASSQPFFAMLDTNENALGTFAYTPDKDEVKKQLQEAYKLFQRQQ